MRYKMILMLMPLLIIIGCDKEPVIKKVIVREVVREYAKKVLPVEHIMDSVVHIRAESASAQTYDEYTRAKYGQSWQGSGCFIRPDGVILTAGHVIKGAAKIWVTLRDGTELEAKYFWQADNMDIGFIKVEADLVPCLQFDTDGVKLVDDVYIVGHPLGIMNQWSITKGIVSNIARDCEGYFGEKLMIQSDAAAWPGNSGGPVVDASGNIIGVLVGGINGQECLSYIVPTWIASEWADVFFAWLETR
jgi:S1-C subfamily serine protease